MDKLSEYNEIVLQSYLHLFAKSLREELRKSIKSDESFSINKMTAEVKLNNPIKEVKLSFEVK